MEPKTTLNVLGKDEQKAIALDIFKNYPKAQKVSVASDGQAFITDEGEGAAKNHAKNNRYQKVLELTPFKRDSFLEEIAASAGTEEADPLKKDDDTDLTKKVEDTDPLKRGDDKTSNTTK